MDAVQTLQRIIDADYGLAALQTSEPERLLAMFKRLTLTTGKAIYHWQPDSGLYRLGAEHILIPRTRTPKDVLSYISAARHYGIYMLEGFDDALTHNSIQHQMEWILTKGDGVLRLMIVVDDAIRIPERLRPRTAVIRPHPASTSRNRGQRGQQAG